ncbi:MAG: GYF domain-containing protein [Verrucomicrobiia bacterium]
MNIHITRNGEQHGPYPEESARQMLEAGQLLPADLAWHEGADGWKPLSEVLGAAAQPPATPPSPPAGGIPKRTMAGAAPAEGKPEDSEGGNPDQIRVTRKGEPIGPYSREKAKEYFTSGQLLPTDWGWHDGMDDWKPINEVLGMAAPAQNTAAAGKPGKGKKVAMIAGIVVLLSGLIFAGITYGPDLVAKISGGSLEKRIIGTWKDVEDRGTVEFLEDGTVKLGTKIAVKSVEMEGSYKFISKDRIKTKFNFMGKTKEDEQLVSIEGDTLTLTTIDPDTGKEDPTDVDKFKRAE